MLNDKIKKKNEATRLTGNTGYETEITI